MLYTDTLVPEPTCTTPFSDIARDAGRTENYIDVKIIHVNPQTAGP